MKCIEEDDDCVICIFLPYLDLYESIPMNEYKAIKQYL